MLLLLCLAATANAQFGHLGSKDLPHLKNQVLYVLLDSGETNYNKQVQEAMLHWKFTSHKFVTPGQLLSKSLEPGGLVLMRLQNTIVMSSAPVMTGPSYTSGSTSWNVRSGGGGYNLYGIGIVYLEDLQKTLLRKSYKGQVKYKKWIAFMPVHSLHLNYDARLKPYIMAVQNALQDLEAGKFSNLKKSRKHYHKQNDLLKERTLYVIKEDFLESSYMGFGKSKPDEEMIKAGVSALSRSYPNKIRFISSGDFTEVMNNASEGDAFIDLRFFYKEAHYCVLSFKDGKILDTGFITYKTNRYRSKAKSLEMNMEKIGMKLSN